MMTHDAAPNTIQERLTARSPSTPGITARSFITTQGPGSFYLDKALIGSANANWSNYTMKWLCIGAWPNPAGSCRDIAGYIDAFAVSDTALDG
jgi:hypothetical protein